MKKILIITSKQEGLLLPSVTDTLSKRGISSKEIISDKQHLTQQSAEAIQRATEASVVLLSDMHTDCVTMFKNCSVPVGIIYLISEHDTKKIREAYSRGADMCLADRLDPDLLPWQLEAVFRHYPEKYSLERITIGEYEYNPSDGALAHPDVTFKLSPKQRMIFEYLARRRNKKVLKTDILQTVYGEVSEFSKRSLDVHLTQLRRMLSYDPNISIRTLYVGTMSLIVRGESDFEGVVNYAS